MSDQDYIDKIFVLAAENEAALRRIEALQKDLIEAQREMDLIRQDRDLAWQELAHIPRVVRRIFFVL